MVVQAFAAWQRQLSEDVSQALAAGELAAATDPEQVAFARHLHESQPGRASLRGHNRRGAGPAGGRPRAGR
ncbi:TetR family transcriptional regulator C-terminal domain-containing protein [Pseudonocardia yunnanensis]